MKIILLLAAGLALTGCGGNTACYGVTDSDLFQSIQQAYAGSSMTPEMARIFRLDKRRVIAVYTFGSKGEDALTGVIFRQDDGGLLTIRLFEDCTYAASPGGKASELRKRAYPLSAPRF